MYARTCPLCGHEQLCTPIDTELTCSNCCHQWSVHDVAHHTDLQRIRLAGGIGGLGGIACVIGLAMNVIWLAILGGLVLGLCLSYMRSKVPITPKRGQ